MDALKCNSFILFSTSARLCLSARPCRNAAPPGSTGDVEEPAADAIDEDDGDDSVTCAICLSTYEDEEVVSGDKAEKCVVRWRGFNRVGHV